MRIQIYIVQNALVYYLDPKIRLGYHFMGNYSTTISNAYTKYYFPNVRWTVLVEDHVLGAGYCYCS